MSMSLLTGTLRVECTSELKEEIRKSGKAACVLVMDEIKNMGHVVDVWAPNDKEIDIIVEIDARTIESVEKLTAEIRQLEGVSKIVQRISADIG